MSNLISVSPQSHSRRTCGGEVANHEKIHRAHIKRHKELMGMAADVKNVIEPELRVGKWSDWEGILEATKAFSKFVHEHQGIYRRSFFISGASDNLEKAVKRLLWYQTEEGTLKNNERILGRVFYTLRAIFGDIQMQGEKKRFPKKSFDDRVVVAEKLLADIKKEAKAIRRKFPRANGLKEIFDEIACCYLQIERELRESHAEDS